MLLWSYATVVVLGRKSETILPNKIVRRFLFFGVFWIVSDFVRTRTTQDCDGPSTSLLQMMMMFPASRDRQYDTPSLSPSVDEFVVWTEMEHNVDTQKGQCETKMHTAPRPRPTVAVSGQ